MPTTITGTDGVSQVQAGAVESGDLPTGSVLQMQTVQLLDRFTQSISANVHTIISDFDINITPSRSNSTILLQVSSLMEFNSDSNVINHTFALFRGSTRIGPPDDGNRNVGIANATRTQGGSGDADSTVEYLSFHFTDQPNTTAPVTYRLSVRGFFASTVTFNETVDPQNQGEFESGASTITAIEIAG